VYVAFFYYCENILHIAMESKPEGQGKLQTYMILKFVVCPFFCQKTVFGISVLTVEINFANKDRRTTMV